MSSNERFGTFETLQYVRAISRKYEIFPSPFACDTPLHADYKTLSRIFDVHSMVSVRANSQPSTCVQRTHNLPRGTPLLRAHSFWRDRGRPRCRPSHDRTIFDPLPSNESPLDSPGLSAMTLNYNIAFDNGHTVPRTDFEPF